MTEKDNKSRPDNADLSDTDPNHTLSDGSGTGAPVDHKVVEDMQEEVPSWWHLHRRLYNWVLHWANTRFALPALILLAVTEPICVPMPADVMVIALSLGKPKNGIRYGLICAVFSVLGGTIAFLLGLAVGGHSVVSFFDMMHLGPKAQQALELYEQYDFWAISISALTPVPYMIFSWVGGMAEISIVKFILISLVFRTIRFGSEGVLFYFLGARARQFIEKYFNLLTVIAMILLVLLAFLMHAMKKSGSMG